MPALFLYGDPQIWAAKKTLKSVDRNSLESIQSLPTARVED